MANILDPTSEPPANAIHGYYRVFDIMYKWSDCYSASCNKVCDDENRKDKTIDDLNERAAMGALLAHDSLVSA